ncbi:MAG: hypothetical protein EA357_07650 [Micavibrio sp.]|nr:MAG: hypothetical protein EA357_07650 [Micavibrio sp.]
MYNVLHPEKKDVKQMSTATHKSKTGKKFWRRAALASVAAASFAIMPLENATAGSSDTEPDNGRAFNISLTEAGVLFGSYHIGSRGFHENGEFQKYNEFNPGIGARFHIAAAPRLAQNLHIGYIHRNSFRDRAVYIAVENTLMEQKNFKLDSLAGFFPTGYNKRGSYTGPKPLVALSVQGKNRLSFEVNGREIRPYLLLLHGGSQPVLAAGAKMRF